MLPGDAGLGEELLDAQVSSPDRASLVDSAAADAAPRSRTGVPMGNVLELHPAAAAHNSSRNPLRDASDPSLTGPECPKRGANAKSSVGTRRLSSQLVSCISA